MTSDINRCIVKSRLMWYAWRFLFWTAPCAFYQANGGLSNDKRGESQW